MKKRSVEKGRKKRGALNKILATTLVTAMVLTNLSGATLYVEATGEVDSTILEGTSTDGTDTLSVGRMTHGEQLQLQQWQGLTTP